MDFTRDTEVDASTIGDTVVQAIVDIDHDLSGAFAGLNTVMRGAAFRVASVERGAGSGVCDLDGSGKIPTARLPVLDGTKLPAGTLAPVGTIGLWGAETPPAGWIECDGTKLNTEAYSDLFAVIEFSFGGSSDEGEFAVPDLRGQFIRGWNHGANVDPEAYYRTDRGDGYHGDNVGTKQATQYRAHPHSVAAGVGSANYGAAWYWPRGGTTPFGDVITASGGVEGRPKNVSLMWIIKITASAATTS